METAIAIRETEVLETGLAKLKSEVDSLIVRDQSGYIEAQSIAIAAKTYIKDVGRKLDPGIDSAKDHLNTLKNQKQQFVSPAEQIALTAKSKADTWRAEEERKAAEEQRRINEERRIEAQRKADEERREREKQAEIERKQKEAELAAAREAGEINKREETRLKKQAAADAEREKERAAQDARAAAAAVVEVKVESNVPKVAGVPRRTNYFAEVTNQNLLIDRFLTGDAVTRDFLRQFITVDAQAIGRYARDQKDNKAVESAIPGVRAWSGY